MINKPSQPKQGKIVFVEQDDPRAGETLRSALKHAEDAAILGLVVKVKEDAAGEQVVNWMFTDAEHIKYLALTNKSQK